MVHNKSFNIRTLYILMFFCFIPLFPIDGLLDRFSYLKIVYMIWACLSLIILIILSLYNIRNLKMNYAVLPLFIGVVIYFSVILYRTPAYLWEYTQIFAFLFAIVLLTEFFMKVDAKAFIHALYVFFNVLLLLNTLSVIIFPSGLTTTSFDYRPVYLLGDRNYLTYSIIPFLTIIIVYAQQQYGKLTKITIFQITSSTIIVFITGSATGIVCMVVFSALIILTRIGIKISISIASIIYMIVWIFVVILRRFIYFSWLIEDILQRNTTLTTRTFLWDVALEYIRESPIIGWGATHIYTNTPVGATAHNAVLKIAMESGLLVLGLFISFYILSIKGIKKTENSKEASIIVIGVFTILINMLTESQFLNHLSLLLIIGYNLKYLLTHKMS